MPGKLIRAKNMITREMLRANPDKYYVFGDNMIGRGLGGQAKEMRGEPNAIGIPTKHRPERDPGAYFCDNDWYNMDVRSKIVAAFEKIKVALEEGHDVVVPFMVVGTGRAELPQRAPKIMNAIMAGLETLHYMYGEKKEC